MLDNIFESGKLFIKFVSIDNEYLNNKIKNSLLIMLLFRSTTTIAIEFESNFSHFLNENSPKILLFATTEAH